MTPRDYPARPLRHGGRREHPAAAPDTQRVFVAVFPPPEVLEALASLRTRLDPALPGLRWVAVENLHFTLRFFGDRTADEIERAAGVLDAVGGGVAPFDLALAGLGVFPGWSRPRVLWVGCSHGAATLEALARSLEHGFRNAGLGRADKPFVPHLTLGRWRDSRDLDRDAARTICTSIPEIGTFRADEVVLMRSRLDPRGSIYTPLHRARFAAPEPGA